MNLVPIDVFIPKTELVGPPLTDYHEPDCNAQRNSTVPIDIVIVVIRTAARDDRLKIRATQHGAHPLDHRQIGHAGHSNLARRPFLCP